MTKLNAECLNPMDSEGEMTSSRRHAELVSLLSGENNFGGQPIIKKARSIPGLCHVDIFELPHLNIQHEQK
jgi:hypothetical protein